MQSQESKDLVRSWPGLRESSLGVRGVWEGSALLFEASVPSR
jgi:hypothetical protein